MITYYLEMYAADELIAKPAACEIEVHEAEVKNFRLNKFLYQLVGEEWDWTDKLDQADILWKAYAESDNLRTWVAYIQGSIAGYYELDTQDGGNVEIRYFGLAPDFLDKGVGGFLLTHAVQSAWDIPETQRLWVHTCSLDHPRALENYKARGFTVYDEVES